MCPDTSCPLWSLGTPRHSGGTTSELLKMDGCEDGDTEDLLKQYSTGTEIESPDGITITHSPPEARVTRSIRAGPKNHVVNVSQQAVSNNHCKNLEPVWTAEGLVAHRRRNAAEVQPHAFLIK